MELGSIEREIFVDASPEVVFEVVSSPDHVKQWWPDDARYSPEPGGTGEIVFGEGADRSVEQLAAGRVADGRPELVVDGRRHELACSVATYGASRGR